PRRAALRSPTREYSSGRRRCGHTRMLSGSRSHLLFRHDDFGEIGCLGHAHAALVSSGHANIERDGIREILALMRSSLWSRWYCCVIQKWAPAHFSFSSLVQLDTEPRGQPSTPAA